MIGKVADLVTFASARGVFIEVADGSRLLTLATDYLNGFQWLGEPYDLIQVDAWPRFNFTSPGGAFVADDGSVTGITRGEWVTDAVTPRAVVDAAYLLAMAVNDGVDLNPVSEGKDTIQETVGPITMVYDKTTVGAGVSFPWWDNMLGSFLDSSGVSGCNFDVFRG